MQVVNAPLDSVISWHEINWSNAHKRVRKLQLRIVKATKREAWREVRNLQRLLTNSLAAKQLAVKRVTETGGRRTPGIDNETWSTPETKAAAVYRLTARRYKAKPLRRVYIPKSGSGKKQRPLSIPTMYDRAMQALYKLALEPIAETLADRNSYGFRPARGTQDAIEQCRTVLAGYKRAQWIMEGDIKSCYDNIAHTWLLGHIPLNRRIQQQWLKAGFIEKHQWFPTEMGVAQGGVISPTVANMTLDGLEKQLNQCFPKLKQSQGNAKVNYVRFADDFIITGKTKEILEEKVKPLVESFLTQRGLRLSETKTRIINVEEGFDFLGQHIRKYTNGAVIIKPSKKNCQQLKSTVKQILKEMATAPQGVVIKRLSPILIGWANYHRHIQAKQTFQKLDNWLWQRLWKWARRRHPNKGGRWVKRKYFPGCQNNQWAFCCLEHKKNERKNLLLLPKLSRTVIRRHIKIKKNANPYDMEWEAYFEERMNEAMRHHPKKWVRTLWLKQKGICACCQTILTQENGWHLHHIMPRVKGGETKLSNLLLVHPNCHRQLHYRQNAGLAISAGLIHA